MKYCPGCKQDLPLNCFHGNKARYDGKHSYCKNCRVPADKSTALKMKYGIDLPTYEAMLDEQGGVCAICNNPETRISYSGIVQTLSVDHDHLTGRVRALLCDSCNTGIARFKENPEILRNAIDYLERFSPGVELPSLVVPK